MKKFFKKTIRMIGFHGSVLFWGLCRVLVGTLFTVGLVVGVYGFGYVPNEGGYDAVWTFICSLGAVLFSIVGIYLLGHISKEGFEK